MHRVFSIYNSCVIINRSRKSTVTEKRHYMKKAVPYLITLLLLLILGGAFCKLYFDHYMYTSKHEDLDAYYGVLDEDDFPVIYDNLVSEMHARRFDGAYYLDYETVKSLLNDHFYFGEKDGTLIYCYPDEMFVARLGDKGWESDASGRTDESYAPVLKDGDTLYIALDYVRKFTNFYYAAYTGPNRIVLRNKWGSVQMTTLKGDTNMRTLGGVKSPIIAAVQEGTDVLVLDPLDDWTRIETADGYYGYVENKYLTQFRKQELEEVTDVREHEIKYRHMKKPVCLAWTMTAFEESNTYIKGMLDGTKAINVLAPTWFTLVSEEGEVNCKASEETVQLLHSRGIQIWAVLDNFQNEQQLACTQFLYTLEGRQGVIKEVVSQAQKYGIDGINVDIEGLSYDDGPFFVEFVRELCIACRRAGLYVSIDNYVPYNFNDHVDLKEQARFADYIVIMGYDEHYAGSEEAGSVASTGYVEYGIKETLKEVPAERMINGIPFYTRSWTTEGGKLSSELLDMVEARKFVESHEMKKEWNSTAGQYYAEKQSGKTLYQIWLEDKKSIRCKLDIMRENGISDVAVWRLGLETNDVWDEIAAFVGEK